MNASLPLRVAVIATEYRADSHADVIVSRWLKPFATDAKHGWGIGQTKIVSMHVEQLPGNDMSAAVSRDYGIPRFDTVEGALTLGGENLAVDAVLLIGEHGDYPSNEHGQKLYPRKELFDRVMEVFRREGKVVPVFFDKHFSWNIAWGHEMYWTIREMAVPFFGGSSLTHTPLVPSLSIPPGAPKLKEIVAIYWNSLEAYLFHSLEVVQGVIENRRGGETGIASVTAWKGDGVWDALDEGLFSFTLLEKAAAVVGPEAVEALRGLRERRDPSVYAFQLTYRDGLKATHFKQDDHIRKWSLAWEFEEDAELAGAYVETGGREEFFPHFARLNRKIEDFLLSRESPIPLERLYLTSLATAVCMQALSQPGKIIPTPWLELPVPRELVGEAVARRQESVKSLKG